MKWIGQHIWDQISRFRSDVYLESVSESAQDHVIGIDANGKLYKQDVSAGDITGVTITTDSGGGSAASDTSGSADFSILGTSGVGVTNSGTTITVTSVPGEIDHDSLLNFASNEHFTMADIDSIGTDGDTLQVLSDILVMTNSTSTSPSIQLTNTTDDAFGPAIKLTNQRGGSAGADGDDVGQIFFQGYDDQGTPGLQIYAEILGEIHDATSGEESGKLSLRVANHDGGRGTGLYLTGGSADNTIDATIGLGTTSTTTVAGDLAVTSDLTVTGDTITFESANADDPQVIIRNTTNDNQAARLQLWKSRTDAQADNDRIAEVDFIGEDAAGNSQQYSKIMVQTVETDHGSETGKIRLQVAEYDGTLTDGLILTGQNANGEIDATIGAGAASTTTIAGTLTMGSTATLNNSGLLQVANQSNITGVGTISSGTWQGTALATAYIADDAVTFAKASGVTPNVYGSVIKLIPSDFMANDDGGNTKFGVGYVEAAGSAYGMRVANNATELFAFVSIPEGMKAVSVHIYDKNDLAMEVFEAQINATTMSSKGSGNCNTTLTLSSEVNSTATNFLVIAITTTSATNDKVYGGIVTIAAI